VTGGTDIIKDLVETTGEVLGIGSDRSTEGHTTLTGSLEGAARQMRTRLYKGSSAVLIRRRARATRRERRYGSP
jgi:hypothetical protein